MKQLTAILMLCAAFIGGAIAQIPSYVPQNGLVGWWEFKGSANDSSPNGINGTGHDITLTTDRFGTSNSAYSFNGSSSYIDLGNNPLLDFSITDDVTFVFWFKTSNVNCQRFYSKRDFYAGIEVLSCQDTILPFYGDQSGNFVWDNSSEDDFTDSNWHQLAVVFDQGAKSISVYIDNILQATTLSTSTVTDSTNHNLHAGFGANPGDLSATEYFNGVLDDIGIWNRILTPSEISTLFNAKLPAVLVNVEASICNGGILIFNDDTLTTSGTYYDTIVSFPADTIISMDFTVLVVTEPVVTQSNDTLTTGNYSAYQWWFNGDTIAHATAQEQIALQNGHYHVVVTDTNGCKDTSAVVTVTGVGIEHIENNIEVILSPNPNTGKFTLSFVDDKEREVSVIDVLGKTVVPAAFVRGSHVIVLPAPAAGNYFVRIKEGKHERNMKVVVKGL